MSLHIINLFAYLPCVILLYKSDTTFMVSCPIYCCSVDGNLIKMTEDHRVVSYAERQRIQETGEPLRDGETRLCGK